MPRMTFDEYADKYSLLENPAPAAEREAMAAAAKARQERAAAMETAIQLKAGILKQLEQSADPQAILYLAVKCIGLLTDDPEYISKGTGYLDAVWEGLEQQSLIQNNAEIAAERAKAMQEEYRQKLRNSINRQLSGTRKLEKALNDVLTALNATEPDEQA